MIKHISASQVQLYETCPFSWQQKYIYSLSMNETTDYYAEYGTLCHKINQDIADGKYFDIEFAIRDFDKGFASFRMPAKMSGEYYQQGKELIARKFEELPTMNIIQTEAEFRIELEDIYPMVGYIDLVYRDDKGRLIVRDYKTSKPYGKSQLDKQWQPFFYAYGCKELYGEFPYAFEFDFIRFDKSKIIMIDENYLKFRELKLKGICNKMAKRIQVAKYNPFYCQNFCENSSICPMYQKKYGGWK